LLQQRLRGRLLGDEPRRGGQLLDGNMRAAGGSTVCGGIRLLGQRLQDELLHERGLPVDLRLLGNDLRPEVHVRYELRHRKLLRHRHGDLRAEGRRRRRLLGQQSMLEQQLRGRGLLRHHLQHGLPGLHHCPHRPTQRHVRADDPGDDDPDRAPVRGRVPEGLRAVHGRNRLFPNFLGL
jgi:hypothetical protein